MTIINRDSILMKQSADFKSKMYQPITNERSKQVTIAVLSKWNTKHLQQKLWQNNIFENKQQQHVRKYLYNWSCLYLVCSL